MVKLILAIVISGLFFPTPLFAETITLKSGKKIEGKILDRTDKYIKIESDGALLYYKLQSIAAIDKDQDLVTPVSSEDIPTKDARFYLKEGFKYGAQARFEEAEQEFKKGLALDSSDNNLKEAAKMIADLNSGAINKEYAVYLFKGSNYLINEQYQQAITEFMKALELKPDDADLNYYLGVCHYSSEQYTQAITYLNRAQEIKPDEEINYYLGACYYSLAEFSQAIAYLEKTLKANPNDAEAYSVLGTSYYFLGEREKAKANLNKAKELFENQGDYLKAGELEDFLGKKME